MSSFSQEARDDFNLQILRILEYQRLEKAEFDAMHSHYTEEITVEDMVAPLCSWAERVQEGLDELCEQGLVITEDDCFYKLAGESNGS